jgi:hypothetical protein
LTLAPLATVSPAAAEEAPFDWRGFYIGYHLGASEPASHLK